MALYRLHSRGVPERVEALLSYVREIEALVEDWYGFSLRGRRILEVGAGQRLLHLAYFSRANDVVGIDLEVIAQGLDPRAYTRMLRVNGFRRTAKTIVRKLLRIDARYRSEARRQLALERFPRLTVLQMDASRMTFPDASFDFVFSYSVFHHLDDPAAGFREVARVLRVGGVAFVACHLYTSATGCLDPRYFPHLHPDAPRWPHLRPAHVSDVQQNATLNKLGLAQWRELASAAMPGSEVIARSSGRDSLVPHLARLREQGELVGYSDEELLANEIVVLWQKTA